MGVYKIDNNELKSTYGIRVEKIEGLYDMPKRKRPSEHDWQDEDGEEPYLTVSDQYWQAKNITLICNILNTTSDFQTKIGNFINLLKETGIHRLEIPDHTGEIEFYVRDGFRVNMLSYRGSDSIVGRFVMTLRVPSVT